MKQLIAALLIGTLLELGAARTAVAQDATPAPDYSADEFVRAILAGPQPCPAGKSAAACEADPKTRRFTLATPAATAPPQSAARAAAPHRRVTASDILVTFKSGSAEITSTGQRNLENVAAGLNRAALRPIRFEVAGYTDANGRPAYNLALSKRRADAVREFLISHDIEPERLQAAGFGSEHLANPDEPTADENRRVELHRLN